MHCNFAHDHYRDDRVNVSFVIGLLTHKGDFNLMIVSFKVYIGFKLTSLMACGLPHVLKVVGSSFSNICKHLYLCNIWMSNT